MRGGPAPSIRDSGSLRVSRHIWRRPSQIGTINMAEVVARLGAKCIVKVFTLTKVSKHSYCCSVPRSSSTHPLHQSTSRTARLLLVMRVGFHEFIYRVFDYGAVEEVWVHVGPQVRRINEHKLAKIFFAD